MGNCCNDTKEVQSTASTGRLNACEAQSASSPIHGNGFEGSEELPVATEHEVGDALRAELYADQAASGSEHDEAGAIDDPDAEAHMLAVNEQSREDRARRVQQQQASDIQDLLEENMRLKAMMAAELGSDGADAVEQGLGAEAAAPGGADKADTSSASSGSAVYLAGHERAEAIEDGQLRREMEEIDAFEDDLCLSD